MPLEDQVNQQNPGSNFEDYGLEDEGIVSNLSCPNCPTTVEVYYNISEQKENNGISQNS